MFDNSPAENDAFDPVHPRHLTEDETTSIYDYVQRHHPAILESIRKKRKNNVDIGPELRLWPSLIRQFRLEERGLSELEAFAWVSKFAVDGR